MKLNLKKLFTGTMDMMFKDRTRKSFFDAIMKDDAAKVNAILTEHPDAYNWKSMDGSNKSAFDTCMMYHKFDAANELFAKAPQLLTAVDDDLRTVLHRVSALGDYRSISYLLSNKAEVDIPDAKGKTPLMLAAASAFEWNKCADLLIDAGAKFDAVDAKGDNIATQLVASQSLDAAVKFMRLGLKIDTSSAETARAINVANYEVNIDFIQEVDKQRGSVKNVPTAPGPGPGHKA